MIISTCKSVQIKIFLLLLFLLTGCTSRRPELFLGDRICPPPCWYQLRPGQSTIDESLEALQVLPFVDRTSMKVEQYHESDYVHWNFSGDLFGQGRLYFDGDGRLKNIILTINGLDLGTLVDAFGEPEKVWPYYWAGSGGGIEYDLSLFYPEKGIVVGAYGEPSDNPRDRRTEALTRGLTVSSIEFFAPTNIETYLKEIKVLPETQARIDYIFSYLQPWPGFGQDVVRIGLP